MSDEAIARLRGTLNRAVREARDAGHSTKGITVRLVVSDDLRALLDAHTELESAHTEALDALERVHKAEQAFAFDRKGAALREAALREAWEHAVAVLAKAGRRE